MKQIVLAFKGKDLFAMTADFKANSAIQNSSSRGVIDLGDTFDIVPSDVKKSGSSYASTVVGIVEMSLPAGPLSLLWIDTNDAAKLDDLKSFDKASDALSTEDLVELIDNI